LRDFVSIMQCVQVMCTNHVVEMLIKWLDVRDWKLAFESVIPTRKRKLEADVDADGEATAATEERRDGGGEDRVDNGKQAPTK
jgi:tRNA (guanine9-N1)-methyltransferase